MKLPAKCVAGLLPLVFMSGCTHKTNQAQVQQPALAPPIVDSPPAKTTQPVDLPPPVITAPAPPATQTTANTPPPQPPPKPKHKRPPATAPAKPADQTAESTQQTASNGDSVPAIGQLSTGDPGDLKSQTEQSIAATEKGLHDIGRKLNDQEQKTAEQIEEFIKEAKKALTTGDVDGAHTLAGKAKVLLAELTQ